MSPNEQPHTPFDERSQPNAVSVYGQTDAMDDFPVLKAFQQYIDAEQTKSRKRMVMLCIFFGCLMAVVISVFIVMLHSVSERNQTLNDRFLEYMMQERVRAPVQQSQLATSPTPANPATDAALKAMTDSIASLQKQLLEQKTAADAKAEAQFQPATKTPQEQELEALAAKRALVEAERKKIAEEKELLHQQEVERQRRRLYPEYYQDGKKESPSPSQSRPLTSPKQTSTKKESFTDQDVAEILAEVYGDDIESAEQQSKPKKSVTKQKPKKSAPYKATKQKPKATTKATTTTATADDDDVDSILDTLNDDDYTIPVDVDGSSSDWKIPLE